MRCRNIERLINFPLKFITGIHTKVNSWCFFYYINTVSFVILKICIQEDALYAEETYDDYGEYDEQYVDPAQPTVQGDKGRSRQIETHILLRVDPHI